MGRAVTEALGVPGRTPHSDASWEKFLRPESLRGNLVAISMFISAFEMFRDIVVSRPETFFLEGFDERGLIIGDGYQTHVLSRSPSKLYASLLWFQELGAIDASDLASFDLIRRHRNELAHEMVSFLTDANKNFDHSKLADLLNLMSKIERWWIREFELAIDPDMLPEGANPDDVLPGSLMTLQLMQEIALGREPTPGYYYDGFKTAQSKGTPNNSVDRERPR